MYRLRTSDSPAAVMYDDIQVVIPFRDSKLTKAALKYTTGLLQNQNVQLRLIDVHVVPYGVPLDLPIVHPKHLERRLKDIARASELPVSVEIVYARDWEQGLRRALMPGSIVLLPIRRAWWRSSEKRMAARLRRFGHTVIWVDCD